MTNPIEATPFWLLTLAFWLHMVTTVVWIGGLALLTLFLLPAARQTLSAKEISLLLDKIQPRFNALGWFSLITLLGTGLVQMSANPNYHGLLAINNNWSAAILAKHIVFLAMICVNVYLTWWLLPAHRRATMLLSMGAETPEIAQLASRQARLMQLNLLLGVVVLGLTAVARAS